MTRDRSRLDAAVAQKLGASRAHAQALILEGAVFVNGIRQTKAGAQIASDAAIEVVEHTKYASRGGYKLEHALDEFGWSPEGLRCLDVGASTGGFTDCLLQRGAKSVTALDVGYGQIAWRLRSDLRVTVIERLNFRFAEPAAIGAPYDFVCADVSYIGLTKLAAQFARVLRAGGCLIALVKPQFEAGRKAVGRGGVVRDPAVQAEAIRAVAAALEAAELAPRQLTYSPLQGPAGNIEFLLGATKHSDVAAGLVPAVAPPGEFDFNPEEVVRRAHEALSQ